MEPTPAGENFVILGCPGKLSGPSAKPQVTLSLGQQTGEYPKEPLAFGDEELVVYC